MQYVEKQRWVKKRVMPLWALQELVTAGRDLHSLSGAKGYSEEDIKERFDLWGGVARYVLEKISAEEQNEMELAISNCKLESIVNAMTDPDAENGQNRTSHRVIHMTANSDLTQGKQVFATSRVKNKLVQKFPKGKTAERRMHLADLGSDLTTRSFKEYCWEHDTVEMMPKGIKNCWIRNLESNSSPKKYEIKPAKNERSLGNNLQELASLPEDTFVTGKHTNLPVGDVWRLPSEIYQITSSSGHKLAVNHLATALTVMKQAKIVLACSSRTFLTFETQNPSGVKKYKEEAKELENFKQFVVTYNWNPPDKVGLRLENFSTIDFCMGKKGSFHLGLVISPEGFKSSSNQEKFHSITVTNGRKLFANASSLFSLKF